MRVAVVGAGVSGLVAARVLSEVGHDVTVFERCADLGGVWSSSRRYPGVSTQDDRLSYAFSDAPMPASCSQHPTGAEVQAYLVDYAARHGLLPKLRLGTTVVSAELVHSDREWSIEVADAEGGGVETFDQLVASHGTYSSPHVPVWPGRAAYEAAGGTVVEPASLGDGSVLDGRDVAVIGWGKTACDVAVVAAERARSVSLVAREVWWKYPKAIGRGLSFKHLVLTRLGEHVLVGSAASFRTRAVRLGTSLPRRFLVLYLRRSVTSQLGLREVGLVPRHHFAMSNSLVTEGLFEAVRAGRIRVFRDVQVADLADRERPVVLLSDGQTLAADVVVAATGYEQELAMFAPSVRTRLVEPSGELLLYRQVLPLAVPRLAFVGWSHSYRSPLTAEAQSWWLAGVLLGLVRLPPPDERRRCAAVYQLTHARARSARANQVPATTIRDLDLLLRDLGQPLPRRTRLGQLVRPTLPDDYAHVLAGLVAAASPAAVPGARTSGGPPALGGGRDPGATARRAVRLLRLRIAMLSNVGRAHRRPGPERPQVDGTRAAAGAVERGLRE